MKKPSYKVLATGIIIIIVFAALLLYFWPMEMSDLINEDYEIRITRTEVGVRDGEPYIDTKNYDDLTEEQRQDIMSLFQQYTYRRTLSTFLISDGALSETGDQLIDIFMYEGSELVCSVIVSNTGSISVNDRLYVLENPSRFIEELLQIVE